MLGPHLTRENRQEVLARAKHRTEKEIAKLVRVLDPLPAVPARIEALGPVPRGVIATNPTWAEQVASFCPVRELTPGDRPRDWVEDREDTEDGTEVPMVPGVPELPAPARITEPLRYKVQFTATEEHVNLLERAGALLSRSEEPNGIEAIHLRALRDLVERLEKRRFGAPKSEPAGAKSSKPPKRAPRRSRHIPAHVRRAVFERDGARCTYVDAAGQRCRETHHLEFHHLLPFARGGEHDPGNLTLRCTEHNALAAELDFGLQRIADQRTGRPHQSARQADRKGDFYPRQRGRMKDSAMTSDSPSPEST